MKSNVLHIIWIMFSLVACIGERSTGDGDEFLGTRGKIDVEILVREADEHDFVRTVRFVVFDDASVTPTLDINELVTLGEGERDATRFKTTLDVKTNPDKMLVVIVNEPQVMTNTLDAVIFPEQLEEILFQMNDAFGFDHVQPLMSGIPMSGVKRKIVVEKNVSANEVITIERVVARVELWLKKTDEIVFARLSTSMNSRVFLENTYGRGYLVTGTETDRTRFQTGLDIENNFGYMQIPSSGFEHVVWNYRGVNVLELSNSPQLICVFYTPERTYEVSDDRNKLFLDIRGITSPDGERGTRTALTEFTPKGGGTPRVLTEIRRNNVYRIIGTVKEKTVQFEQAVLPWTEAGQGTIIDPQYYLRVSRDVLHVGLAGDAVTISVETNYNRGDRGFPKGVRLGEISYYDKDNHPLEATAGGRDWLAVNMSGVDGDLSRNIEFIAKTSLNSVPAGYYALVEIKAGNLIKIIRVTRS